MNEESYINYSKSLNKHANYDPTLKKNKKLI